MAGGVQIEGKRMSMKPWIRQALRVQIAPSLVFNHPRLHAALTSSMRAYGSKWQASADGARIAGKIDFAAFLRRAQCVSEH